MYSQCVLDLATSLLLADASENSNFLVEDEDGSFVPATCKSLYYIQMVAENQSIQVIH